MSMIRVDVRARGPLCDGRAERAAQDAVEDIVSEISREGQNRLVGKMALTFRHPTPYYWTQVWTRRMTPTLAIVNDARSGTPMIYGPWLEGTGSRNKISRFKGYWIWRSVRQFLQGEAEGFGRRILATHLPRMR